MWPLSEFLNGRLAAALLFLLLPMDLASQDSPQVPPIRVSTHLVQFGVIVRDSSGPVTDLAKDDFVVLDRGKPQKISVFSVESNEPAQQPVLPLPQNTFSDLPQYGADVPKSVTIVLLDNLNTLSGNGHEGYETGPDWMEDLALANAKAHLIDFIKNLDPKDRVAIYGLSETLHVMCDFTSDRDRLLTTLKNYDTTSKTSREAVQPGSYHTPVPGKEFNDEMDSQSVEFAGMVNQNRAAVTIAAMQAIASHVANIPGRKNLVWLTANLPFSGDVIARILAPANIAAYPVDARGLLPRTPSKEEVFVNNTAVSAALGLGTAPAQSDRPVGIEAMEKMAEDTGGRAFINTNDLTGAIRKAVEDSAVTYTLGFYLEPSSLDGRFHELKVQVRRSGLNIRYAKGYFALKDVEATQDERHSSFLAAIRSPLDSSAIPLEVKVDRVKQSTPDSLTLLGSIGIQDAQLVQSGGIHLGTVDIFVIEQDDAGKVVHESTNRINLRFTEKQYPAILKTGVTFRKFIQPQPGVTTLRVLVQDPRTAAIGSLIIPLASVN